MAFSHDKFIFLILCFIIPQLIILKANNSPEYQEQECEFDVECNVGENCDTQEGRCFEITEKRPERNNMVFQMGDNLDAIVVPKGRSQGTSQERFQERSQGTSQGMFPGTSQGMSPGRSPGRFPGRSPERSPGRSQGRRNRKCKSSRQCNNGQYCDTQVGRCFEEKNVTFKGACERNGGKFLLFPIIKIHSKTEFL